MTAGTVISGGFPGRVAQEVQPNQKCGGCLHYDGQAGRTGACTIGLRPWLCGEGDAADIGYAPLTRGAGAYLPDMSNHDAQAREVETQFVSELYGAGSTRPVQVQHVSLGENHVNFIKSMVDTHSMLQRSMCRLCANSGAIGTAPANVGPQVCTCEPMAARDVAKALAPKLSNLARSLMTIDDVIAFVYDVAKAGYKLPLEKASFFAPSGRYDVSAAGEGKHHVAFHPHGGGASVHVGTFNSRGSARHGASTHAQRFASGSGRGGESTSKPTRQMKVGEHHSEGPKTQPVKTAKTPPGLPSMKDAVSVAKKGVKKSQDAGDLNKGYTDDWLSQFKGTPLFTLAHKLCEQELAMREAQITRQEERQKHNKERDRALAKLAPQTESHDWQAEDALRQRLDIAKQKLSLKLAEHQQKMMAKALVKAIDNTKHSHVVTGKLQQEPRGFKTLRSAHNHADKLDLQYGGVAHTVQRNPNFKPPTSAVEKSEHSFSPGQLVVHNPSADSNAHGTIGAVGRRSTGTHVHFKNAAGAPKMIHHSELRAASPADIKHHKSTIHKLHGLGFTG